MMETNLIDLEDINVLKDLRKWQSKVDLLLKLTEMMMRRDGKSEKEFEKHMEIETTKKKISVYTWFSNFYEFIGECEHL